MIRVLVVDDSPTARALLKDILSGDPEVEVAGEARDGAEAVERTQRLRPDVVTMDLHMPRLDGLEATREIMITAPTPIVLVTASTRADDAGLAMEALRAGAVAVLLKPAGPGPRHDAAARELLDTVKAMAAVKVVRHWRPSAARAAPAPPTAPAGDGPRARLVAIATSTGGPVALQRALAGLPVGFAAPLLVVQHITPGFTAGLADWLASSCGLPVKIAAHGEALAARAVYLAPDGRHLGVTRQGRVALADTPPVGGFRPSATHLFESAAHAYGAAAVGVILTGMGEDGVAGLRELRRVGGRVLAQDEASSVVYGMPGAAVAAGLADQVLPLDLIAGRLAELVDQRPV
jgi:two-component system chemotaxis response regulator CheB